MSSEGTFVVTAYRNGLFNDHTFTVYAGPDPVAALAAADEEYRGRGLKYGVEVIVYPAEERVAYLPSYAEPKDATGPTESAERHAAHAIGSHVLTVYKARKNGDPLALMFVAQTGDPELPSWLEELCAQQLAIRTI